MAVSLSTRQAYTEVYEFLGLLDETIRNKVPTYIMTLFEEEKDNDYTKKIDADIPIKEQGLKEETLALIAMLNLRYWCEDEQEKQRLIGVYKENEQRLQEATPQVAFNPDIIFDTKSKPSENTNNEMVTVTQEEKGFRRIIKKILNIFKK